MSIDVSDNQATKIKEFLKQGMAFKQQGVDISEALKDLTKTIGDDIGVKPALLSKALSVAFKNKAEDERENFTTVEEILAIAGLI